MHYLRRKEWKHRDIPWWTENQVPGLDLRLVFLRSQKKKRKTTVAGHNGPGGKVNMLR